jgi:uncharacterized protein with HEPN domain
MSNMSLSVFAGLPAIPLPAGMLSLLRERYRTQLFATFQVLCESTQRIAEQHKQGRPEIHWPSIASMRNVPVHDYFEVDFETVWLVVTRDHPPLEKAMRAILAELDETG